MSGKSGYSDEFKREVVAHKKIHGTTKTAKKYSLNMNTLPRWEKEIESGEKPDDDMRFHCSNPAPLPEVIMIMRSVI